MEPFFYMLKSGVKAGDLQKMLGKKTSCKVVVEKGKKFEATLYDSFDDRLLKNYKFLLETEGKKLLLDYAGGALEDGQEDSPDGEIVGELEQIAKLRAFLKVGDIRMRFDRGLLLDDEQKTRARFRHVSFYYKDECVCLGVTQYMRGYQKAYRDLIALLKNAGAVEVQGLDSFYRDLGIKDSVYELKPVLPLNPSENAKNTAALIISAFLDIARVNEPWVMKDCDTEFLHDYRVSLRKVRSVLGLFKGVYSKEETRELKREFGEIMRRTNRLRDLDVYLLERDNYFNLVPDTAHRGMDILFDYLQQKRDEALAEVTRMFASKTYRKKMNQLQKRFSRPDTIQAGPEAGECSRGFGSALILKRYAQVCRIAATIDDSTEDEIVHQLRISCKKLRYLMEFLTPLFPSAEMKGLIKRLKKLQDNLGKFNDFSVQQNFLRQIVLDDLQHFNRHELEVTEAIGALTAMLFRLQQKERAQVMKNFAKFNSEETKAMFTALFQKEEGA